MEQERRKTKVIAYAIMLALPLKKLSLLMRGPSIKQVIEEFKFELKCSDWDTQDEILLIIQVLKKAFEYNGTLLEIDSLKEDNIAKITLSFESLEILFRFQNEIEKIS